MCKPFQYTFCICTGIIISYFFRNNKCVIGIPSKLYENNNLLEDKLLTQTNLSAKYISCRYNTYYY